MNSFETTGSPGFRALVSRLFSKPVLGVLCLILFSFVPAARAHDPGLSSATFRLSLDKLDALLVFSLLDIKEINDPDLNQDGKISAEELAASARELEKTARQALDVTMGTNDAVAVEARCRFDTNNNATVFLSYPVTNLTSLVIRSKLLAMLPPGHRQFFSLENPDGVVLDQRMLTANSDTVTVTLDAAPATASEQAERNATATKASFSNFLMLGVRHIWTGYDHLLFLLGLLIVTRDFRSAIKIITCFTIAHTITLAISTLNLITVRPAIVEPLIAASIVYVGLENLFRKGNPKARWMLTFAFGLIHGFGFAASLKQLGVGSNGAGIAVPLLSFNLGVELGQISVALLILPLFWFLQSSPRFSRRWVYAGSLFVAFCGAYWFIKRVWFA